MNIVNRFILSTLNGYLKDVDNFVHHPIQAQNKVFASLIKSAENTEFGKKYDFSSIQSIEQFRDRVPLHTYEDLSPYIERMLKGEPNILWNTPITWFSKSSGTTGSKSKLIPVSKEALKQCHYLGGKELYALYLRENPQSKILLGKNVAMGGSYHPLKGSSHIHVGDVSAIIMNNLPKWAEFKRVPSLKIALMDEWETKIEAIAQSSIRKNVTNISGVPSWTLLLLKRILEITGKQYIDEVWPNFECFFHGGVSFAPYRSQFEKIISRKDFNFVETYNASEGFFSLQDRRNANDMLLLLNNGIFYEFLPMSELDKEAPRCIGLEEVQTDTNYALVISTNGGLWRYLIGDTIQFTSLQPYRIQVSGRTKNFINAFGEEVIVDNAEKALLYACEKNQAEVSEYTAGPVFIGEHTQASHQWLIEFKTEPRDMQEFVQALDQELKNVNSDYEAKRYKDMLLKAPIVVPLPKGSFYAWLKYKNKLGGQHKIPRLANHREYIEEILQVVDSSKS